MERGKTKQHVRSVCDYTEVACAYENLGCGVRMLRKDIKKHQENDDNMHLQLALRNSCLCENSTKHCQKERRSYLILQVMPARKRRMRCSSPIHATPGGYKMCIRVDANGLGTGKGTYVLVFTKLLQGRYDDQLHWPFLGMSHVNY